MSRLSARIHAPIRYQPFWGIDINASFSPLHKFWVWLTIVGWEWPRNWFVNKYILKLDD